MQDIVNNVNMSPCPVTFYNLSKKVLSIPNIDLELHYIRCQNVVKQFRTFIRCFEVANLFKLLDINVNDKSTY